MGTINFQLFETYGTSTLTTSIIIVGLLILFLLGLFGIVLKIWARHECRDILSDSRPLEDRIDHLFVKVSYRNTTQNSKVYEGYLTALNLYGASMVSYDRDLERSAILELDLEDIFNCKCNSQKLCGKVVRCRSLGGFPESWAVDVKFLDRKNCYPQVREVIAMAHSQRAHR